MLAVVLIYILYRGGSLVPISSPVFTGANISIAATVVGAPLKNKRVVTYRRVSDESQKSGTSLPHQKETLNDAVERMGGTIVDDVKETKSGATTDRKGLNTILEQAENDEFDVLAVTEVDRLTRAEIFESFQLFKDLSDQDVTLFVRVLGIVDWDDLMDIRQVVNEAVFARRWYERIQNGAASGCIEKLKDNKWPFGDLPFGYTEGDDDRVTVNKDDIWFIRRAFKLYLAYGNRAKARDCLNKKLQIAGREELSDRQMKSLLESGLCIGELRYKGVTVNEQPGLQVVPVSMFDQAQEILQERNNHSNAQEYPEYIDRALGRYGLNYMCTILDSLARQCRECGSTDLKEHGSAETFGETCRNYQCQDCGYQDTLLNEAEMQELHQTCPLRCPYCPQTNDFDCEETPGFGEYLYTCQSCGHSFKSEFVPNKIKRALNNPDVAFDMSDSDDFEASPNDPNTSLSDSKETDYKQLSLADCN